MADVQEGSISPAYRIPLSEDTAARVGAFVAIWGQIDHFMGICIAALLKVDIAAAETLLAGQTAGPRLNLFSKLAKEKLSEEFKQLAKDFSKDLSPLIETRNHIMHGVWGFKTAAGDLPPEPALYYSKRPDAPILIKDFPDLINRASEQSHRIVAVAQHLLGFSWTHDPQNPPTYYFGSDPPPGWPQEGT